MARFKLEPAYSVIRKFDTKERRGSYVLSQKLQINRSAVSKWTLPNDKKGTGGYIPPRYYAAILAFAEELGISLDPSEFVVKRHEDLDETEFSNSAMEAAQSC